MDGTTDIAPTQARAVSTAAEFHGQLVALLPKLRVQAICFLGVGTSDSSMQGSPLSSRQVRSSTTPQVPRTTELEDLRNSART